MNIPSLTQQIKESIKDFSFTHIGIAKANIYEEDYNTAWFYKNGFTADSIHPNTKGAKKIAEKIKEYL